MAFPAAGKLWTIKADGSVNQVDKFDISQARKGDGVEFVNYHNYDSVRTVAIAKGLGTPPNPDDPGSYGSEFATITLPGNLPNVQVHAHPLGVKAGSAVVATLQEKYKTVYEFANGTLFVTTAEVADPGGNGIITVNLEVPGFGGRVWFPNIVKYLQAVFDAGQ